ncbi:Pyridoxal phosphate homeostasis protein, partial [Frankliniella fusca]
GQRALALAGVLGQCRPPPAYERGQTTSLQSTIRATPMETLFHPADVAALRARPHPDRIPMSPHCAAAINSVKAAAAAARCSEPAPLSNLEYLPPPTSTAPEAGPGLQAKRPDSAASLTETIAKILQIDPSSVFSSLYRAGVGALAATSSGPAPTAWRSAPQVRSPKPPWPQTWGKTTTGTTGAVGAGSGAGAARDGADNKIDRRKFKIDSAIQSSRPAVKTAHQIAQLTARLRLRHGRKARSCQGPLGYGSAPSWSLRQGQGQGHGHGRPKDLPRAGREVPETVRGLLAPPASAPTLGLDQQEER